MSINRYHIPPLFNVHFLMLTEVRWIFFKTVSCHLLWSPITHQPQNQLSSLPLMFYFFMSFSFTGSFFHWHLRFPLTSLVFHAYHMSVVTTQSHLFPPPPLSLDIQFLWYQTYLFHLISIQLFTYFSVTHPIDDGAWFSSCKIFPPSTASDDPIFFPDTHDTSYGSPSTRQVEKQRECFCFLNSPHFIPNSGDPAFSPSM